MGLTFGRRSTRRAEKQRRSAMLRLCRPCRCDIGLASPAWNVTLGSNITPPPNPYLLPSAGALFGFRAAFVHDDVLEDPPQWMGRWRRRPAAAPRPPPAPTVRSPRATAGAD